MTCLGREKVGAELFRAFACRSQRYGGEALRPQSRQSLGFQRANTSTHGLYPHAAAIRHGKRYGKRGRQ